MYRLAIIMLFLRLSVVNVVSENKSSAQLMSAFSSAINKNISKSSIQQPQSPPTLSVTPHRDPSSNAEDDHGFKNRDLQQEVCILWSAIQFTTSNSK